MQKRVLGAKVDGRLGVDLSETRIAVWGLSIKPNTDDMWEAPSVVIIHELLVRGANVTAYDPFAMDVAKIAILATVSVMQKTNIPCWIVPTQCCWSQNGRNSAVRISLRRKKE